MHNRRTILALFNSSPYAIMPWLEDGRFNVVSVDWTETDHSEEHGSWTHPNHTRLNIDLSRADAWLRVIQALAGRDLDAPSLVLSFPPCTDLAVSGARHFKAKLEKDPECQNRAVIMAKLASQFGVPYCAENPVSVLATKWRAPDHRAHPFHWSGYIYGADSRHPEFPDIIPSRDRYKKLSCYWTGNGFIWPMYDGMKPLEGANPGWAKLGGKSARTKYIRSLTPRGWAMAVYQANVEALVGEVAA